MPFRDEVINFVIDCPSCGGKGTTVKKTRTSDGVLLEDETCSSCNGSCVRTVKKSVRRWYDKLPTE